MTDEGKPDLPIPAAVRRLVPFLLLAAAFAAIYFVAQPQQVQQPSPPSSKAGQETRREAGRAETPPATREASHETGRPATSPADATWSQALATGAMSRLKIHDQPRPLPAFTVLDRNGKPHRLDEWKGRALLVNFWASWCPPCLREMPEIIALERAFPGKDFDIIAISEDYKGYDWAAQALKTLGGQNLVLLWDKGNEALRKIGERGLPVTLLLDRQGREVARLVGPADWNSPEAHAVIRALMAKK